MTHHNIPPQNQNQPSVVVKGRVISGAELRRYAEANGMCIICGLYSTHERVGNSLRSRFEPKTTTNRSGDITVYKGYCVAPTCYTLEKARNLLGENTNGWRSRPSGPRIEGAIPISQAQREPRAQQTTGSQPEAPLTPQNSSQVVRSTARHCVPFSHRYPDDAGGLQGAPRGTGGISSAAVEYEGSGHITQLFWDHGQSPRSNHGAEVPSDHKQHRSLGLDSRAAGQKYGHAASTRNPIMTIYPTSPYINGAPTFHPTPAVIYDDDMYLSYDARISQHTSSQNVASSGTDVKGPLVVGSNRQSFTDVAAGEEEAFQDPLLKEMDEKIQETNYLEFINLLDNKGTYRSAVLEAFRLLRFYVVRDQQAHPDGVVLVGENWVKVINEKIRKFQDGREREVVISGLLTLLTLSMLPGTYTKCMIRKDAMQIILKVLDESKADEEAIDIACSVVISLSLNEKFSLNAKTYPKIAILIRMLTSLVVGRDECGRGYALRALLHISNQRRKSEATGKPALHDIRNAFAGEKHTMVLLETVLADQISIPVAQAGLGLLWRLSVPKDDEGSRGLTLSNDQIASLLPIWRNAQKDTMEAACGLLANLSLDMNFPVDLAQQAAEGVCEFLADRENRTNEISAAALQAFCNLLANSKFGLFTTQSVLRMVLSLLQQYPQDEEVVEYGCLAIGHAGRNKPDLKRYVVQNGGVHSAQVAFETFVTSRGDDPVLEIKDASLCALASLSGVDEGAQLIAQSGLPDVFQAILAVETDEDFQLILTVIVNNCNTVSAGDGILLQQPTAFAQLLRNLASEEEVLSLIQELRDLGEAGLEALGNHGFDVLVDKMTQFEYSATVQEESCALLAEIFYRIPLSGVELPMQLPGGSWAVIHSSTAVEVLCNAMASHRAHGEIQVSCMIALANLLSPLCSMDVRSSQVRQVQPWLEPVWRNTFEALSFNAENCHVQEHGMALCFNLKLISFGKEFQIWMLPLLQHVFDGMRRFRDSVALNLLACDILLDFQNHHEVTAVIGNSGGVEYLFLLLDFDDLGIVTRASAALASLVAKVFTVTSQIVQIPNALQKLIACMNSHQREYHIQISLCEILQAIINFEDNSLLVTIAESGGLVALCNTIDRHSADTTIGLIACHVLAALIPPVDANLLLSARLALETTMMRSLSEYVNRPEIEAAVMDVLCTLGGRDEHFKVLLESPYQLQLIISAMTLNLGSEAIQRSGCSILWLLSGVKNCKQKIGEFGGIDAILNAMMAHNECTFIQKEGLTALKNLATEPNNKPRIAEADGVRVVTFSLWINYNHPTVISCALSALNNIAVDSTNNTVAPLALEILEIIIHALRRFPDDEGLQKNACFYLKSCTYRMDNLELMRNRVNHLRPVLLHASNAFPRHCQVRAQSILRKIESTP